MAMVQKNRNTRLPRSKNTVVEFGPIKIPRDTVLRNIQRKSKYRGVRVRVREYKESIYVSYPARIQHLNKVIDITEGRDEKTAAIAYDKMAISLKGPSAYTNQMAFPEDFNGCDRV